MKVKIYQPTKNAMQSGKKNKGWILIPTEEENSKSISNITGWTSSSNTQTQLQLSFHDKESAVAYAKQQGFDYEVIDPQISLVHKKSYADNFC